MPLLVGVGVLVLFVLVVIGIQELKEKQRRAGLRQAAEAMGFSYAEDGDQRLLDLPADFLLFAQGVSSSTKNAMQRPWTAPADDGERAPEVGVFEYIFNVKFGRYMQSWTQTVVRVASDSLALPTFSVMPQRVFDALATRAHDKELREKVLSSVSVKLPQYPSFTEQTHIMGYDRLAVQALFNDALIALLDNSPKLCLEAGGSVMVLYSFDEVVPAAELSRFVDQAMQAYALLKTTSTPIA